MPVLKHLKFVLIIFSSFLFIFLFVVKTSKASPATHVVISEVQIGGATTLDEFVELYNPTSNSIDLTGWRLQKKSPTGTTASSLVASMSGILQPHSYFLIAHPSYTGTTTPDLFYSGATPASIASDNTVIVYSDAGTTIVDKVGMGTAVNFETADTVVPPAGSSIERVNNDDTDNNSVDFSLKQVPNPQNSSFVEQTPTPNPTATATEIPTPTPTATPIQETPTPTPSATAVATETPVATGTPVPTETPTENPSPTPTIEPSPTATPIFSPSPSPTVLPTPKPKHEEHENKFEHFRHSFQEFVHKCFRYFTRRHNDN